jgi:transposase
MQLHLDQIISETAPGRHAVLVLDRAAWHTTKKLNTRDKITLIHLPPASPELNPTEQVWRQLREDSLANRSFIDYEDISISACQAWNQFVEHPGSVKKLCSRVWANL